MSFNSPGWNVHRGHNLFIPGGSQGNAFTTFSALTAVASDRGGDLAQPQIMNSSDGGFSWVVGNTPLLTHQWTGLASSGSLRCAVAVLSGDGNQVMTNVPGNPVWNLSPAANANQWNKVTYGGGQFVAVALTGALDRVMTSPDGVNWTLQVTPQSTINQQPGLTGIVYNPITGLYVATSNITDFNGNSIVTSPTGVVWTLRNGAQASAGFQGVAFGNGRYVAVGNTSGSVVSNSTTGFAWTNQNAGFPANHAPQAIAYGNGLFVAVSNTGTGTRIATSPDGVTWTARVAPAVRAWTAICFVPGSPSGGIFVAVAGSGLVTDVMVSLDGVNWSLRSGVGTANWSAVCSDYPVA